MYIINIVKKHLYYTMYILKIQIKIVERNNFFIDLCLLFCFVIIYGSDFKNIFYK